MTQKIMNEKSNFSYGLSHRGKVRSHNEDAFLDLHSEGFWLVADGAGGHEKGEVASQLIVKELSAFKRHEDLQSSIKWIVSRLRWVNERLIEMRSELASGGLIGSTVCALLFHDDHCVCIWSGDSRIYNYHQSQLSLLTQDHNRMEEFFQAGFSELELANYPVAGQLTKAIGASTPLSIDVQLYELNSESSFLLCSDGLTGEIGDSEIAITMSEDNEPERVAHRLLKSVLNGKARDNVTILVVSF